MNDQQHLMAEARAIAGALAECGIGSVEVLLGDETRTLDARLTDLPTELLKLCETKGVLRTPVAEIRASGSGFDIASAHVTFNAGLEASRGLLARQASRHL